MVSIIKNQLLKHLSRFTKNLSADKINLSTFKGEGEFSNLELNEIVLTDLLELPSWLRLTSAWCNRVSFRIQWRKLKSVPIYLSLDTVNIEVETCEELRSMSAQHGLSSYTGPAKYSFINKVIDGITVAVNLVQVTFKSPAFVASVQMAQIMVESKSPAWQRCDLRISRLKDADRRQLLIFKELEWQTVRIEAMSTKDENLTPLRLLTNQARCRITIKKRIADSFIMGSRLVLILDDLLWVLTDSQLKAALCFLDSLAGLVQKSTELTRVKKAARKLEVLPEYQAQISQQARTKESGTTLSCIFTRYDVVETSYHFVSQRIDLHICDDSGAGRSVHPDLKEGAALQIEVHQFQVDYYPYHLAIGDRKHWPRYREEASPHSQWLNQALTSFHSRLLDLVEQRRPQHAPLNRSQLPPSSENTDKTVPSAQEQVQKSSPQHSTSSNPAKNYILKQLAKLMTSCVILRIQDFTLYQVTTSQCKQAKKEFFSGRRSHFNLPEEVPILHAEFTYYYYPGDISFPLPPPKFYVQLNPVQIHFDVCTCLWLNAFLLNLHQSLLSAKQDQSASLTYVDVKMEAILPKLIFDSNIDHPNQKDRPKSLHIQVSRASVTNVRSLEHSSRADLAKCVDALQLGSLFYGIDFPSKSSDFHVVTEKFIMHISGGDNVRQTPTPYFAVTSDAEIEKRLSRELLWSEAKDVWCVSLEPVWGDFVGAPAVGSSKSVPFLDAVPITLWLHGNTRKQNKTGSNFDVNSCTAASDTIPFSGQDDASNSGASWEAQTADIHALAHVSNLVSLQLNHYQYLFLLRLSEDANELATVLALDSNRILKQEQGSSMVIGALIPQVEVTFVMPSQSPGKECSGGDLESVIPDSASLQEENVTLNTSIPQGLKQSGPLTPSSEVSSLCTDLQHQMIQSMIPREQCYSEPEMLYPKLASNGPSPTSFSGLTIPNNLNAGLSSMKKGFSNLMTSLDSALKSSPDDVSDTASLRSDVSSDSENFVVVNYAGDKATECLDVMFQVAAGPNDALQPPELANEVVAEEEGTTTTSPSERSLDSSIKRRDLVSMSTFKLGQVEFTQQSQGFMSILKVQVASLASEECGSIPWDEFQAKIKNKFGCRSRAWMEVPVEEGGQPRTRLRLVHNVNPGVLKDRKDVHEWSSDHLEAQVTNLDLELNMSTIVGLMDLVEDEIIPQPLPMQISLDNIKLLLNEDRPSSNITSPGPIPLNIALNKLSMQRGKDGVFHLEPQITSLTSEKSTPVTKEPCNADAGQTKHKDNGTMCHIRVLEQSNRQLLAENAELRHRLAALEKVSEENHMLRQLSEESQVLQSVLTVAQDKVAVLLDEKQSLVDRLWNLQEQLDNSQQSKR